MDEQRINHLFKKYFDKSASEAEQDELMHYINDASDEEITSHMEDVYQSHQETTELFNAEQRSKILNAVLAKSEQQNSPERGPRNSYVRTLWSTFSKIAALLVISLAIGSLFYKGNQTSNQKVTQSLLPIDIAPGGDIATLTLANGSVIGLNEIKEGGTVKQAGFIITKTDEGQISYIMDTSQDTRLLATSSEPIFNTINIPRGGKYQIKLPDGTKVWLNSASSLTYPTLFSKTERKVTLTGEAYFEVARDTKAPFIVMTEEQSVTVLGTHFNIRSYDVNGLTETTLLEGSVRVSSASSSNNQPTSKTLKPGEQAVLNAKHILEVKKVNVSNAVSWKNGLFYFEDTDIRNVMEEFSRWYNFDFELEGKMPAIKLWGKVHRNVNASEALDILSYFNLKYRIVDAKAGSRKKVIITHL